MKTDVALIESDSVVISMMRANSALAGAVTVSQTKKIMDVARAAEIYAKRQHLSDEAIGQATSVKVDAMRKLGEILQATPKSKGEIFRGTKKVPRENDAPTLDELGLTKKESAVAQKLAALPEKAFEQVRDGSLTIAKAIAAVDASKPTTAAATTKPALTVIAPTVLPEEETEDAVVILSEENDRLNDRLATVAMEATDEERAQALKTMTELRAEIKTLRATLKAVQTSRDTFQNQVADMQAQINRQRREIDRATGLKTA